MCPSMSTPSIRLLHHPNSSHKQHDHVSAVRLRPGSAFYAQLGGVPSIGEQQ